MESVPVVAVEDVLLREDVRAVLDAERERLLARAASVLPHDDMGASAISGALLSVSRVRDALGLGDDPSTRGEQGGE